MGISQSPHRERKGDHEEITRYDCACQRLADLTGREVEVPHPIAQDIGCEKLAEILLNWLKFECFRKEDDSLRNSWLGSFAIAKS